MKTTDEMNDSSKSSSLTNEKLTNEMIQNCYNTCAKVYEEEVKLTNKILHRYCKNVDVVAVAIKICVIDVRNSTHLSTSKEILPLHKLAEIICNIKDFDNRIKSGDPKLVNELAKNTKTNGRNLFSFASKYCYFHNHYIYHKDDFSIYDASLQKNLCKYDTELDPKKIDNWRKECNYEIYNDSIGKILDKYCITLENRREKFDFFIWEQAKQQTKQDKEAKKAAKNAKNLRIGA